MEEYLNRLASYKKPEIKKLDEVSSAGYYYDPYSHIATHEHFINDYDTVEKYRKWIENNKHLIKVRNFIFPHQLWLIRFLNM